jgi:transposase
MTRTDVHLLAVANDKEVTPVRATTLLSTILGMKHTRVEAVAFDEQGVVADVAPTTTLPRCSGCFCRVDKGYDARQRCWRHLDLAGMRVVLRYKLRRVDCPRCGVRIELVPWAEPDSWFTRDFEEHTAYLAQTTDKTTVVSTMRVAWRTVGDIARRVVDRVQRGDPLDGLKQIGVDELSYRRHHEYITVVIDHVAKRVVWARPGKDAATLGEFFKELGPERCKQLEAVTIDMSGAYIKAVTEASPQATMIFDRFHVQRLAQEAVDEVRRAEVRESRGTEEAKVLKRTRFILLKNPWNLTNLEGEKLAELQRTNKPIYRAYMLKEGLAGILDGLDVDVARTKLGEWIRWAGRSRLEPFKKLARTVKAHFEGILAYIPLRLNNGRTEGMNGKIRTITRRSYGFHSASNLIALIFLCCSGISLLPVLKVPPAKTAVTSTS